ncbi:imine reductase family protein [Streptomyces sp. CMB-StM0423]|uniref:imine reductase family protein n=1 Tax=Streptomyces sp. CMB-StM0423 TaxID=2059884 RepID=UPI002D78CDC9|nr:hypothetical protein [Streptomyces sp. CMB-StM0423]
MAVAGLTHVVRTAEDSGVDPSVPAAVLELFGRAVAADRERGSLTSLIELWWFSAVAGAVVQEAKPAAGETGGAAVVAGLHQTQDQHRGVDPGWRGSGGLCR